MKLKRTWEKVGRLLVPRYEFDGGSDAGIMCSGGDGVVDLATNAWNPSDKSSTITLSGSNLIATSTNGSRKAVRANLGVPVGKKVIWRVLVGQATGTWGYPFVGVTTAGAALNSDLGGSGTVYGIAFTIGGVSGYKMAVSIGTAQTIYGSHWGTGDVLGFLLDRVDDTFALEINGTVQATAFTGLSGLGDLYPTVAPYSNGDYYTAYFSRASQPYAVPAGYLTFG